MDIKPKPICAKKAIILKDIYLFYILQELTNIVCVFVQFTQYHGYSFGPRYDQL